MQETLWAKRERAAQWFGNVAELSKVKIDIANIIRQANRE